MLTLDRIQNGDPLMAHDPDPDESGTPDLCRINFMQEYEVRYWIKKFGYTKFELQRAITLSA